MSKKAAYLLSGYLILLAAAYLDNIRGPVLPLITRDFHIHYSKASWFFVTGNLTGILCTLLLLPLMNHFSERKVLRCTCLFAGLSAVLAFNVHGFFSLIVFAVALGATLSVACVLCNILTVRGSCAHDQGRWLSGLHCMYGYGSMGAPLVAALLLQKQFPWQHLFVIALPVFVIIALISRRLPEHEELSSGSRKQALHLSAIQWLSVFCFATYVVAEVISSAWMVTYLVETKKLPVAMASRYLIAFFAVLGSTRLLCIWNKRIEREAKILWLALGTALLCSLLGHAGFIWALPLVGVLGPFFPLYMARITRLFVVQNRSLTIWVIVMMQVFLTLAHLSSGLLTDALGARKAYLVAPLFIGITLCLFGVYMSSERKLVRP